MAMARPMPLVDPVTRAVFLGCMCSSRAGRCSSLFDVGRVGFITPGGDVGPLRTCSPNPTKPCGVPGVGLETLRRSAWIQAPGAMADNRRGTPLACATSPQSSTARWPEGPTASRSTPSSVKPCPTSNAHHDAPPYREPCRAYRQPLAITSALVRLALGFGALVAVVVLAITQFRALALHGEQMMRRDCWRRRVFDPTCRKSLTRPNTQKQQRPCAVDLRACGSVKIGGLGQFGVGANKEAQNVRGNESTPLSYQSSTPLRDLRPAAERCRWAINAYGPPQSSGGAAHFPPTHGG